MAWARAGANAGKNPGSALTELQPRPQAQEHRDTDCACPSCSYTEAVSVFFALPPTFFTFVIVVDQSKIPQKWAQQGFLSLGR